VVGGFGGLVLHHEKTRYLMAPALAAVVPLLPTIAVIAVVAYVLWIVFINIELPSTPFGDVPEYPAWMDFDSEGNPVPTVGSFFKWLGAGAPGRIVKVVRGGLIFW